jgi:FKBP-type peptidyl-prolyl cis-trans isomerase
LAGHRPGVELLADTPGTGAPVERHRWYDVRLQMWLSRGEAVRWTYPWGLVDRARIEAEGTTLFTTLRVDREFMFAGLFYGVDGMRVGGRRRLRVAPHLAYREAGIPGVIPSNALLTVEIEVISQRTV